jgi:hypothetical protein
MTLKTDELITLLAQASAPKRPINLGFLATGVLLISALATLAILGLRPELIVGQPPVSFWIKTALLSAMAIISLRELSSCSKPVADKRVAWPILLLAMAATLLIVHEWLTVDVDKILGGFLLPNFRCCLIAVTLYGGLGMVGFTALMRRYAPTDLRRCAGCIGWTAAAVGALGYSIHCPLDSPTFITVAYGLPMVMLWAAGRFILPRHLNW